MRLRLTAMGLRAIVCGAIAAGCVSAPNIASGDPTPDTPKPTNPPEKKPTPETPSNDKPNPTETKAKMPALAFKMKDINGNEQDLRQYQGNVVLMVNVASKCGLTPQYEGLQKLYDKYKDRGFVILGFPANNFLKQEPGTEDEIKAFCKKNYGVTFPMFSKISVKGKDQCELYAYLTNKKADHKHGGKIEWNFAKFLINRDGTIADRFSPRTEPGDDALIAAVEKELKAEIPADSALGKKRAEEKKKDKPAPKPEKQDA